jgi:hypothetical protein
VQFSVLPALSEVEFPLSFNVKASGVASETHENDAAVLIFELKPKF